MREKEKQTMQHAWTFLNQNKGLVLFQCHFTVLRQFKHSHSFPPNSNGTRNKEVVKPFVELWWKLLVPRGWIFLSHGLWWGESRVCPLDSKPRHLILGPQLLLKHFVDTGFCSHEGWSVLMGICAVIMVPTQSQGWGPIRLYKIFMILWGGK